MWPKQQPSQHTVRHLAILQRRGAVGVLLKQTLALITAPSYATIHWQPTNYWDLRGDFLLYAFELETLKQSKFNNNSIGSIELIHEASSPSPSSVLQPHPPSPHESFWLLQGLVSCTDVLSANKVRSPNFCNFL